MGDETVKPNGSASGLEDFLDGRVSASIPHGIPNVEMGRGGRGGRDSLVFTIRFQE